MKIVIIILIYFTFTICQLSYAIDNVKNVAVVDFIGKNISQLEAVIVSDHLRRELDALENISVIEKQKMIDILEEEGYQIADVTTKEIAIELGNLLNVKKVIIGSVIKFEKLGEYFYITVEIVNVGEGEIYITETVECDYIYEFKNVAEKLTKRLADKLIDRGPQAKEKAGLKLITLPEDYYKWGVGLSYPYISFIFNITPKWSIEPKIAIDSEINMFGFRINNIFKKWDRLYGYAGIGYNYVIFEAEDLKGWGFMVESYIGGSYWHTKQVAFNMDIGPVYTYLKDEASDISIGVLGSWIVNAGVKFFW